MADLFMTIEDRMTLIIGYTRMNYVGYIHPDISSIIFAMHGHQYTFLEKLEIDYIGIEPALSKFVRYTLFYDDILRKFRPRCMLLYGPTGNNAFPIASAFSKHLSCNDVFVEDIKHGTFTHQSLSFGMFTSQIRRWNWDLDENNLKICILTGVEGCKEKSEYSEFINLTMNRFIKPKNIGDKYDDVFNNTLFIFIADGINNLDEMPPFEWQCPIKIGLSTANKQKTIDQNKDVAMENILDPYVVPIGLKASMIKQSDQQICHYCDDVTDAIKLGNMISGKIETLGNVSLLLRGSTQCGKTMIAEHIALQCHFPFTFKVSFIDPDFEFFFDEDKVIEYFCDVFEAASQANGPCVILIDDLHNLFNEELHKCKEKPMDIQKADDQAKESNSIWNALLALMKRKIQNAKIFVVVTCKYNKDCAKYNILQHFDFVQRIPNSFEK